MQFALAALIALALAALGFGHSRAPASELDRMVAAYVQAGGSLADLCLTDPSAPDHGALEDCPVCSLVKSVALVAPMGLPAMLGQPGALHQPAEDGHLARGHAPRAPPARGPPQTLV